LVKVRIALLAPHQLDHALCGNRRTLVSQQESTTGLEQIRDVIDIEFKVVQKDLEDVQDRVWLSHLEFGKFTVEADILIIREITMKRIKKTNLQSHRI
jgi:hypothetical protein